MNLSALITYVVSAIASLVVAVAGFPLQTTKIPAITAPYFAADGIIYRTETAAPPVTFHHDAGNKQNSFFEITKITENGAQKQSLRLQTENGRPLKKGYLTYSHRPEYYIYYPRLGSEIIYFDPQGVELWRKGSHHYLEVFPNGKHILGMAGDHSRAFVFDPDLNEIAAFDGMLLVQYKFLEGSPDLCLGFLNGEIIFVDSVAQTYNRVKAGETLTSLACDGKTRTAVFQTENNGVSVLKGIQISAEPVNAAGDKNVYSEYETIFEITLDKYYSASLPLGFYKDKGAVLLPSETGMQATVFDRGGAIETTEIAGVTNPDDWRIMKLNGGLAFWSSENILVFAPNLIYRANAEIISARSLGGYFYLYTNQGIACFFMNNE